MKDDRHLHDLLTTFGAVSLGEGDLVAGANTLAAMACVLANVARPGSGFRTSKGTNSRVGASLLVSGATSSSLIIDHAITEVGIFQNHLTEHLRRLFRDKVEAARKQEAKSFEIPAGSRAHGSEDALLNLQQPGPILPGTVEEAWAEVVLDPPNPRLEDLAARPKVLVTAVRAADLERQLRGLHLGHPLVHLGVSRIADFGQAGELCAALMDGRYPAGDGGDTARGNVLITDPCGLLREVAKTGDERNLWLGRLVWLVDGDAGPEVEVPGRADRNPSAGPCALSGRFGSALSLAFGRRLNNHSPEPVVYDVDLSKAQVRWAAILKELEPDLPGIAGAARGLFATLYFGLRQMADGVEGQPKFEVPFTGVEALARFLVRRMAKARAAFLWSAEDAWRRKLKRKILFKIGGGPLSTRDIYRAVSLASDLCEELLLELQAEKLVQCNGRGWQRLEPAALMTTAGHPALGA